LYEGYKQESVVDGSDGDGVVDGMEVSGWEDDMMSCCACVLSVSAAERLSKILGGKERNEVGRLSSGL
jgi:hypothetical protein